MDRSRARSLILLSVVVLGCGDDDLTGEDVDAGRVADLDAAFDGAVGCDWDDACDDGAWCNGAERCVSGECVDGDAPCDACDEEADECLGCADADGDGAQDSACGGSDCDDADPRRFPGNVEICDPDDVDEDCDPRTFGVRDADGDGYADALCCNGDVCGDDCDDTRALQHPGEAESCDTLDNDCDGDVDEGVVATWFEDEDGDSFGVAGGETRLACARPEGFASNADDCDDAEARRNPGNGESCEPPPGGAPLDEDCDDVVDEGCSCTNGATRACEGLGRCALGMETCVAGTWDGCTIVPMLEVCNGEDDNCNGMTDEFEAFCYPDADGDGVARSRAGATLCVMEGAEGCPSGWTRVQPAPGEEDCDDDSPATYPGAEEICDRFDNDCDGDRADAPGGAVAREDFDEDGYAPASSPWCDGGFPEADCQDNDPDVSPAHGEFEEVPYCDDRSDPNLCGGVSWQCGDCGDRDRAFWDWDCSGVVEIDAVTCDAVACGVCSEAVGHLDTETDLEDCGLVRPTVRCTCMGGACEAVAEGMAVVRCR